MLADERSAHPFSLLSPDLLLAAVESRDYFCSGSTLALNSYENRVFQVGLDEGDPIIAKFYRPGRWTAESIQEEHDYCQCLMDHDLPVVAPLRDAAGQSLFEHQGFLVALYPRKAGRDPELDNPHVLEMLGRLLGRLHGASSTVSFSHRPTLSVERLGINSLEYLLESALPESLHGPFEAIARPLIEKVQGVLLGGYAESLLPIHGDLHRGNILWRDDFFNLVDFDDCCLGPAIQDIWMLLSGDRAQQQEQLARVLKGYRQFSVFNPGELRWIESLRSLRIIHYSAWLARRRDDPAFIRAFPWFGTERYWGEQILTLREQLAALDEPPLEWLPE